MDSQIMYEKPVFVDLRTRYMKPNVISDSSSQASSSTTTSPSHTSSSSSSTTLDRYLLYGQSLLFDAFDPRHNKKLFRADPESFEGSIIGAFQNSKLLLRDLEQQFTCVYCKTLRRERENIGRLQCKFHPESYDRKFHHYTCCGDTSENSLGCIRCDCSGSRSELRWSRNENRFLRLPASIIRWISPIPTQIVERVEFSDNQQKTMVVIDRIITIATSDRLGSQLPFCYMRL